MPPLATSGRTALTSRDASPGQRRIAALAVLTACLAALHHVDHIVRANHVGWPVTRDVTPFTYSLLIYPFLLGGAWVTARRGLTPWYWVVLSLALAALVTSVHFNPDPMAEQVKDLYLPYAEPAAYCARQSAADPPVGASRLCNPVSSAHPVLGALAVGEMLVLTATLMVLVVASVRELLHARRAVHGGSVP
jgi:hypothetical protein